MQNWRGQGIYVNKIEIHEKSRKNLTKIMKMKFITAFFVVVSRYVLDKQYVSFSTLIYQNKENQAWFLWKLHRISPEFFSKCIRNAMNDSVKSVQLPTFFHDRFLSRCRHNKHTLHRALMQTQCSLYQIHRTLAIGFYVYDVYTYFGYWRFSLPNL